jgi:hypothetical protein
VNDIILLNAEAVQHTFVSSCSPEEILGERTLGWYGLYEEERHFPLFWNCVSLFSPSTPFFFLSPIGKIGASWIKHGLFQTTEGKMWLVVASTGLEKLSPYLIHHERVSS